MNMTEMKIKKITALIIALAMIFSLHGAILPVGAAEDEGNSALTVVTKYGHDNFLKDINIEAFLIAKAVSPDAADGKLTYDMENTRFKPALTAGFPAEILDAGKNRDWAEKLQSYIGKEKLAPNRRISTGADGKAVFGNLAPGLYLVAQGLNAPASAGANNDIYVMQSFIVLVAYPDMGTPDYTIAIPKIEKGKGTLILKKEVIGNGGSTDLFTFSIEFKYEDDGILGTDKIIYNNQPTEAGVSFWLRAGESCSFSNIPIGTEYEITEIIPPGSDYTFNSWEIIIGSGPATAGTARTLSGTVTGITAISVTANNNPPPATDPTTNTTSAATTANTTSATNATSAATTANTTSATNTANTTTAAAQTIPTIPTPTTPPVIITTTTPPVIITTTPPTSPATTPTTPTTSPATSAQATTPTTPTESTVPEPPVVVSATIALYEEEEIGDETPPRATVTLDNGWTAEYDEEEDVWYIYDENGVPLGIIILPDDVGRITDLEDIPNYFIPLDTYGVEDSAPSKFSPQTGDKILIIFILTALAAPGFGAAVFIRRRKRDSAR